MMKRTYRHKRRGEDAGRVGVSHGRSWCEMEWYVPFVDGHAVIYHGHEDPSDHSECGPQVFCCPKAALMLKQRHPNAIPATAEWDFTMGDHLASWMGERGPRVYYFFFCDPADGMLLRFCGVGFPEIRKVLLKQHSLDHYLETADRLYPLPMPANNPMHGSDDGGQH